MGTDDAIVRAPLDVSDLVTVLVATFPTSQQARTAELVIGRLAAEGSLDVLDGELHDWSAEIPIPRRRTLENVARQAALPASVWACGTGLPQVNCRTGSSAILLFGSIDHPDRVSGELVRVGASTTITTMTAEQFADLRLSA